MKKYILFFLAAFVLFSCEKPTMHFFKDEISTKKSKKLNTTAAAGYLVYTAEISQTGDGTPVATEKQDEIGVGAWERFDYGVYFAETTVPAAEIGSFFIGGTILFSGKNCVFPVTNYWEISGYISVSITDGNIFGRNNVCIGIDTFDENFSYVDLSSFVFTSKFQMPDIRRYQ